MQVVIEELGYRLDSHKEGLCYELSQWMPERTTEKGRYKGRVVPAGWVSADKYPATLGHGLKMIFEHSLNSSKLPGTDLKHVLTAVEKHSAAVIKSCEQLIQCERRWGGIPGAADMPA